MTQTARESADRAEQKAIERAEARIKDIEHEIKGLEKKVDDWLHGRDLKNEGVKTIDHYTVNITRLILEKDGLHMALSRLYRQQQKSNNLGGIE